MINATTRGNDASFYSSRLLLWFLLIISTPVNFAHLLTVVFSHCTKSQPQASFDVLVALTAATLAAHKSVSESLPGLTWVSLALHLELQHRHEIYYFEALSYQIIIIIGSGPRAPLSDATYTLRAGEA